MILFLVGFAAALHDLADLEASASAVAGASVTIDRRLRLAACPDPQIARLAASIAIVCTAPAWRIVVPVQSLAPLIRRGDAVSIAASGPGFRVAIDGIAEADAAAGSRVRVRSTAGTHLTALVMSDGSLAMPGYTLP